MTYHKKLHRRVTNIIAIIYDETILQVETQDADNVMKIDDIFKISMM